MSNLPQRYSYLLDGVVTRKEVLADPGYLSSVVMRMIDVAGMRLVNLTVSNIVADIEARGEKPFADEGGISVLGLMTTSHVALHGWADSGVFMLDLSSCRDFDSDHLHSCVLEWLGVLEITSHVVRKPTVRSSATAGSVEGLEDSERDVRW
jgi:S-adenosylmethionine/arginine decarboxylase-like enzyme